MPSFYQLRTRDVQPNSGLSSFDLSVVLLVLVVLGLCLICVLVFLRRQQRIRRLRDPSIHQRSCKHTRWTVPAHPYSATNETILTDHEKRGFAESSSSPQANAIPEIRITFPDEEDKLDRRQSRRVVVLRIGESGSVGMEPLLEEHLPPYPANETERFQSVDLERIGGLKEKNHSRL